jgi:hypothetical protein
MAHGQVVDVLSLLDHKIMVPESLERMTAKYRSAKPFPHIVIDNMFDDHLLDQLVGEMPSLTADKFSYYNDGHLTQYGLRSAADLEKPVFS